MNKGGRYNQDPDDIDAFLSKLESETASRPRAGGDDLDFDDLDFAEVMISNKPRPQSAQVKPPAPQPQAAKPAAKPAFQQPARAAPPMMSSGSGGGVHVDQTGERLLIEEGYVRHNNKGKFVNFSKGKATDFRIKGTTSSRVGLIHVITLRALDDYGEPCPITEVKPADFVGASLTLAETGREIQPWFKDNGDATYDIAFYCEHHGTAKLQIKLAGNPMFDIEIQIDPSGDSLWVALLQNSDINPHDIVVIAIVTTDDSRPEGVAPFEVQTMGDVTDLKLTNNGDGTYRFQCIPQSVGHCTIQIMLHEQPIKNSPVQFKVGVEQKAYIRQTVGVTPAVRTAPPAAKPQTAAVSRPAAPQQAQTAHTTNPDGYEQQPQYAQAGYAYGDDYDEPEEFAPANNNVTNDDLNRLLDELGGGM